MTGVDSDSLRWDFDHSTNRLSSAGIQQPTILEDDEGGSSGFSSLLGAPSSPRSSQRTSQYSYNKAPPGGERLSVQSIDTVRLVTDTNGSASNRSSATIKGPQSNGDGDFGVDFDSALRKFASARESFLADLSFSAGVVTANKPKPKPKTQRIIGEELPQASGPSASIKSGIGSIRRRISIRDMNSLKRQPSVARQSSVRTSKRMSNYNSVIPSPQPINPDPNMHPLKKRFEPVLLDRYPPKTMVDESKRRPPFPEYVPMFTFPNDINVVSADERPRSTWHGFAMTTEDGSKLHGICVIMWIPLNEKASEELERKCEEWRRKNMTDEERELASSLGERLATERANLSKLLAKLPSIPSGSSDRDSLEEEISAVEEKIGLMTDMLRPVRHGAASKIDGLTDGETGLWVPRSYGVLGRDGAMTSFWKEWLKAVVVPMTNGKVLRVPASSPRVGMWQPLERYVVNLFVEAPSPMFSKTQVEVAIRELRLFARKEAINELPGSRNTDIYSLFRALSIPNIVVLFEFMLTESRIILLSSYTSMLHLVSKALTELVYPFQWHGVFIPVLPSRLLQAIEAPCPYIVGIERRYENIELPSDDFVLVDLDRDTIESTTPPVPMPKQQRRKLTSLLQVAAPHHNRMGVQLGPPPYAVETFPWDAFSSETPSLFESNPQPTFLSKYAGLNSASFGDNGSNFAARPPIYNGFLQAKGVPGKSSHDRPTTSATTKGSPEPSLSPVSGNFPSTPASKNDSGFALQASLREKRSGHFSSESLGRRSSSFGTERRPTLRGPSIRTPFGHGTNASISTLQGDLGGSSRSNYAPSVMAPSTYAQSTIAASTIMPGVLYQPVQDTSTTKWAEGHYLQWRPNDQQSICSVCDERPDEGGIHRCAGCGISSHARCVHQIVIVCSAAFHPEQIRAAFVRCFASLLYTYRKFLKAPTSAQKKAGLVASFDADGFRKSLPSDQAEYVAGLQQTQGKNERS